MSKNRQDQDDLDYDEDYLHDDEVGDGLPYGDEYDLDVMDYEATDRDDLGGYEYEEEGQAHEEGGDVSPALEPALAQGSEPPTPHVQEPEVAPVRVGDIDIRSILCSDHGTNLDSNCNRCEGARSTLHPQIFEALRVVDRSASSIPDASERFSLVKPVKKPTLVLSPTALSFGKMMYQSSPLNKSQFEELVRSSVHLSQDQNTELMKNLMLEKILEKNLSGSMKDVKNLMIRNLKNRRISERPLLVMVDKLDDGIRGLKSLGVGVGLEYPVDPPRVSLMGPDPVPDLLAYSSSDNLLPLPDFVNVLDGVEIHSQEARAKLAAKLDLLMKQITGYRTRATTALLEVYNL